MSLSVMRRGSQLSGLGARSLLSTGRAGSRLSMTRAGVLRPFSSTPVAQESLLNRASRMFGDETDPRANFDLQLKIINEEDAKGEKFSLATVLKCYEARMTQKGYNSFWRKRVLGFWYQRSKEYKEIDSKMQIFDAMSPKQRVFYNEITDKGIEEIAERCDQEPKEVYDFLSEVQLLEMIAKTVRSRRRKGYIDMTTSEDMKFLQPRPSDCFPQGRMQMKNPWEPKVEKVSKYK